MEDSKQPSKETGFRPLNGWLLVLLELLLLAAPTAWIIYTASNLAPGEKPPGLGITFMVLSYVSFVFLLPGFFVVNPNESRVLVLFGRYRGTVLTNGFFWTNIFTLKHRVSLRARNLNGERIKVNDLTGNPIEIAAVVVWRVRDTAQAMFDVDDYEEYVHIQSESAVRHLASTHPYDDHESEIVSLRGGVDDVADELREQLEERFARAGVEVVEARLTHLAYSPEIAGVMLRRQQADAIIAARQKIVDGAVGMVQIALEKLERDHVVELDDERKAAMVSNLLVVLCSEAETTPIVNTGTLYT
ncbi:MAG: SPFH domain-containing protein [Planctomycetes bacterium]|nr:SPFH domain-containing protein [Planctomycetota bacterium]